MKPVKNTPIKSGLCKWFYLHGKEWSGCVNKSAHGYYHFSVQQGCHATQENDIAPMGLPLDHLCYWQGTRRRPCPFFEV